MTARSRPAFISEREVNALILHAANDCFLFVIGCDRGRLLYVSSSVTRVLSYDQNELLGQSVFDIIHPKDVTKVKEQLSSSDISPRERLVDAKTMLPIKADIVADASRLCPGARRSFFCRIKIKLSQNELSNIKDEPATTSKMKKKQQVEKKYRVIHFTGYLKSWAPTAGEHTGEGTEGTEDTDSNNLSCLVAVGRSLSDLSLTTTATIAAPHISTTKLHFVSRHAIDGKFLFVDQRVTLVLGFLPQELLGTSIYEYLNAQELGKVARAHKAALLRKQPVITSPYSFKRKDGTMLLIQTHFKPFKNPWTKDMEFLVANNMIMNEDPQQTQDQGQTSFDIFNDADLEMQCLIDSHVESHKIGSAIAEDVLRRSTSASSPELPIEMQQDVVYNYQSAVDNVLSDDILGYPQVRNNVPLSAARAGSPTPENTSTNLEVDNGSPSGSPPLPTLAMDGNGEAAMAVIMNLLEADAGFGGPMDLSSLPWLFREGA